MATTETITTAEQLLNAPELGRCERVRGELIMMPSRELGPVKRPRRV